jgi:hypothetical protein
MKKEDNYCKDCIHFAGDKYDPWSTGYCKVHSLEINPLRISCRDFNTVQDHNHAWKKTMEIRTIKTTFGLCEFVEKVEQKSVCIYCGKEEWKEV